MTKENKNDANVSNQSTFTMLTQYLKDLSFECPRSNLGVEEGSLNIDVSVGLSTRKLKDTSFEVSIKLYAEAKDKDNLVMFLSDVNYCGIFIIENIPEQQMEMLLGIEAPQLLFPFARRILMTTITDAGFKTPNIEPINFAALYMQAKTQKQKAPEEKKKIEKK